MLAGVAGCLEAGWLFAITCEVSCQGDTGPVGSLTGGNLLSGLVGR